MTVYATRLVNGTDSMERMRHTDAMGLFPSGPTTARGGFRNDGGAEVTVNAGTMTVDVSAFMAYVDGGVSDAQGGYTLVSDGTETLTVNPGHASLTRTDVVICEVRDTVHDGSGSTDARVRILEGTPGAGAPALPTNALALRELNIPAGLSAGTGGLASGNLGTDRRTFSTGLGGTLTVASEAERDALPAILGTTVYRSDTDQVEVLRASGWRSFDGLDAITVGAGQIALGPGIALAGEGVYAFRSGRVVTLQVYVSASGAGSVALYMPAGWRPWDDIRGVFTPTVTTARAVLLSPSGELSVEAGVPSLIFGTLTYVCDRT